MVASFIWLALFFCLHVTLAIPVNHESLTVGDGAGQPLCRKSISPFDYSAKVRSEQDLPVCVAPAISASSAGSSSSLAVRQEVPDDYTCGEGRPCRNGACCPKATGSCNYGPKACGTNNISPNDVCWSNCDAKAECGRYAEKPGTKCPLNVCCSQFGFCGTAADFCKVTDNEETSCQSNCEQPGPKNKDGNVQKRVIGYYEAWNHQKSCVGMGFSDIPVDALTHAYFSFAYITPGDLKVAPMDDLPTSLFDEFTSIKKRNAGLQTIVALGGWTFNDNNTATQPVFSDMVSTSANRKLFIGNLFGFMRKHGFDGVDFDWEYPGAGDRGGKPDDGKNFVTFLKELDDVNNQQPKKYTVSFTIPTSYWYLRHFDLKAVDHVDFVNVMSYDLHGIWDSTNPIGSHIFAHSNLTEIEEALNLLWRNDVPANKLNLGLGFYGRSFTLVDPLCSTPGCGFRGGANKGPCSDNSGTLTYREIQHIIKEKKLTPHHDKKAGVKWINWDQDQWVSYDDADTFKQKIDFANDQGLAGLLIWAVDQDTQSLDALKGVVAPKNLKLFAKKAEKEAFWEDATVPDCYVTDCGGSCNPGWLPIEKQPCGGAKPVTRHSKEADSTLCCPMEGAPKKEDCTWRGSAPSCNGHCHDNEVTLELNRWGDGKYCEDGNKAYCCESPVAEGHQCYWAGVGRSCNNDDVAMTFSGTFLQLIGDLVSTIGGLRGRQLVDAIEDAADLFGIDVLKYYCCPKEDADEFENCKWYGKPGTCFDNHCPVGSHSVQLTDSPYGEGEDCFPRVERTRVYCCDPVNGASPFLPVDLDKLFPNPPTGDDVDTDHELNTDDDSDDPDETAFSFVVMTSPEELQVSLDKRDGSHWALFNCTDTDVEAEQTIQMACTDVSENSNCHKIGLGHGVPGTILQMPSGCGPGKYAVAKEMKVAEHQILPREFAGVGNLGHKPVMYDLTFDYDFHRVPRDLGNTQLRIDYSNEPGYWDEVVAAAVTDKRKHRRSLVDDAGRRHHRRWLEAEYRDDAHFGGLSKEEFHKRWFGETVLEWLGMMTKGEIKKTFKHNLDDVYTAKIVEERWDCPGRDGYLLAQAQARVKVGTSFGFSLVATSLFPLDLTNSYLTFSNNGEITCTFTLEALVRFHYDSKERPLGDPIPFPGAALRIPGLATIGPQLALRGRIEAGVTISTTLEANMDVVSWEYDYRLPAEMEPANPDKAEYGSTGDKNGLLAPTFYAGVLAEGDAKAHLIVALEFGVTFDPRWDVGALTAQVAADNWLGVSVAAGVSSEASCPFTWGMKAGVDLYAQADGFKWTTDRYPLPGTAEFTIYPGGTCPDLSTGNPARRGLPDGYPDDNLPNNETGVPGELAERALLEKRAIGPFFHVPVGSLICPNSETSGQGTPCESISGWDSSQLEGALKRRDLPRDIPEILANETENDLHWLSQRSTDSSRKVTFCQRYTLNAPPYETSSTLGTKVANLLTYDYTVPGTCNDFGFGTGGTTRAPVGDIYATEHILELQMVPIFLDKMDSDFGPRAFPSFRPGADSSLTRSFCQAINELWMRVPQNSRFDMGDSITRDPIDHIMPVYPGNDNTHTNEFVLLEKGVNTAKEGMWGRHAINADATMTSYMQAEPDRAVRNLKDVMTALKYMQDTTINARLVAQKERVAARLKALDEDKMPNWNRVQSGGTWKKWESKDLEGKWNEFMKKQGQNARDKAVAYMDDNLQSLEDAYMTASNQKQADKPGEQNKLLKERLEKMKKLREEWNRYKPNAWKNPFA